jgi:translation initiation factor IF-3
LTITQPELCINERIRAFKVLVIDDEGKKVGIMLTRDAIELARSRGLDLVEVAPQADPPVTRVMDYGKFIYTQQKRSRDAKKKQVATQIKEIKLRVKTEEHDLQTKLKKIVEFLEKGDRVKIRVVYRGREMAHPELGHHVLKRVLEEAEPYGAPVDKSEMQGKSLIAMIAPYSKEQQQKRVKQKKSQATDKPDTPEKPGPSGPPVPPGPPEAASSS